MLTLTIRFVHIFFMATWVGAVLFIAGDAKRTLSDPSASLGQLRERGTRATKLSAISALVTLGSGIGLIFAVGGFGAVPPAIHIGMLTGFAMLAVGGGLIGRSWHQIDSALEQGAEPASLLPVARRLSMAVGIFHALWLLTLGLMVFRYA